MKRKISRNEFMKEAFKIIEKASQIAEKHNIVLHVHLYMYGTYNKNYRFEIEHFSEKYPRDIRMIAVDSLENFSFDEINKFLGRLELDKTALIDKI